MPQEQESGKKDQRSALLHLYLVLKGGAPPATEKQMYTGEGTRDTWVACGDASSWATPWTTKGAVLHGCHSQRMHNHAVSNAGIRGVQTPAGSEPCSLPRPTLLGCTNPRSGAGTATAGLGKQTPATPCSVTRNGMLCKDKEPLWNHECRWAPRHRVCVTEEHPGGRGGSVPPCPAAEGTEPPAARPAPAGGTGEGPRRPWREPRSQGGGVFSPGGKAVRW